MHKYLSTVGLNVGIDNRVKLARVLFKIHDDGVVIATVVSGHTLGQFKRLGSITMTREELNELPDDPYNDIVFAEAAFGLFGLSI